MKFVVLDASIAMKWYIREDDSDSAQGILDSEVLFLAPDILFVEVAGALIRQNRVYKQISKDDVLVAVDHLLRLGIEAVSSVILLGKAVEISLALGHPIKDCFYVALAERWKTVLVTADLQLYDKLKKSKWAASATTLADVSGLI
jgi:predicted nucleic acid-binding protein